MKSLKLKHLQILEDDDIVYIKRNMVNVTVSQIMCNKNQKITNNELLLLDIARILIEEEYNTKKVFPFVGMKFRDVKKCFPNYISFPKGTLVK